MKIIFIYYKNNYQIFIFILSIKYKMMEEIDEMVVSNKPQIEWTPEHEKILIEWADKAMC